MTKAQIGIIGFVLVIIIIFVLIFLGVIPGLKPSGPPPEPPKTTVNFWGLKGEESAWAEVITRYSSANPSVAVRFTGIEEDQYESFLIDNLAANTGPDIFLIHYDWLSRHRNKILPAPSTMFTAPQISEIFPKIVGETFISNGQIFALPISVNTLALAYNRDYFDAKQVPIVPDGWADIKSLIPRLREIRDGRIAKEAISLGGSSTSVLNAPDILTLLMLQYAASTETPTKKREDKLNLLDALSFYIDFSDPRSPNYTLDDYFQNSLDAFVNGNAAMVLIYPEDVAKIRAKSQVSASNLRILPMPQIDKDRPVNLTSFWGLAVSNKTANYPLAWNFINFATTNQQVVSSYATISGNAPALRASINDFKDHPVLKVFSPQILNATTYPKLNEAAARAIFDNMIKSALGARGDTARMNIIVEEAIARVNSLQAR